LSLISETRWIDWTPVDPKVTNERQKAALKLGDFGTFGDFLQELVGAKP
jgi:hypothetical protein